MGNLNLKNFLLEYKDSKIKTIEMNQGQKSTRIVAWTFLTEEEKSLWFKK